MSILLCAATEFEIKPVLELIAKQNLKNIRVLITGIGVTATSYQLTKAVCHQRPSLLLQAGIAGSLHHQLSLAKVVTVGTEIMGDLGVEENGRFRSVFDLGLSDPDAFPWTQGQLPNRSELLQRTKLPVVNSVTINEISTNPDRMQHYRNLGAEIESMEGAALHYVGLMEKIPFLQIRSLSNFAGERDKGKWKIKEAIASLNLELENILLKLMRL